MRSCTVFFWKLSNLKFLKLIFVKKWLKRWKYLFCIFLRQRFHFVFHAIRVSWKWIILINLFCKFPTIVLFTRFCLKRQYDKNNKNISQKFRLYVIFCARFRGQILRPDLEAQFRGQILRSDFEARFWGHILRPDLEVKFRGQNLRPMFEARYWRQILGPDFQGSFTREILCQKGQKRENYGISIF